MISWFVLTIFLTIQSQEPPILPETKEGWLGWALRNLLAIGIALTIHKMWLFKDQDRKYDEMALALKNTNERIGLDPGKTVKAEIDGVGEKVNKFRSEQEQCSATVREVKQTMERYAGEQERLQRDVGGLQSLVRQMIEENADSREKIIDAVHAAGRETLVEASRIRERLVAIETEVNIADRLTDATEHNARALDSLADAIRGLKR